MNASALLLCCFHPLTLFLFKIMLRLLILRRSSRDADSFVRCARGELSFVPYSCFSNRVRRAAQVKSQHDDQMEDAEASRRPLRYDPHSLLPLVSVPPRVLPFDGPQPFPPLEGEVIRESEKKLEKTR